jgi:hypothetical protein
MHRVGRRALPSFDLPKINIPKDTGKPSGFFPEPPEPWQRAPHDDIPLNAGEHLAGPIDPPYDGQQEYCYTQCSKLKTNRNCATD